MKVFHRVVAAFLGKNTAATPADVIIDQMTEPRPLPMGATDFEEWAERIISGALIPKDPAEDEKVFKDSLKFTIASMVMHLGPTESHKPDAYFIHGLRKGAANQVANAFMKQYHAAAKERLASEETKKLEEEGKATLERAKKTAS